MGDLHEVLSVYRASLSPDRRACSISSSSPTSPARSWASKSVGTRAWIALLLGPVGSDPLFLEIKEAQPSVLEDHAGAGEIENHGQRVVVGRRLMQASSDIFLGWLRVEDVHYDGRQLKDWKASAEIEQMDADSLAAYDRMCG